MQCSKTTRIDLKDPFDDHPLQVRKAPKVLFTICMVVGAIFLLIGILASLGHLNPEIGPLPVQNLMQKLNRVYLEICKKIGSDSFLIPVFINTCGLGFMLAGCFGLTTERNTQRGRNARAPDAYSSRHT